MRPYRQWSLPTSQSLLTTEQDPGCIGIKAIVEALSGFTPERGGVYLHAAQHPQLGYMDETTAQKQQGSMPCRPIRLSAWHPLMIRCEEPRRCPQRCRQTWQQDPGGRFQAFERLLALRAPGQVELVA
jgi:hypothetical protein